MHPNQITLNNFYEAFSRLDAEAMAACYADATRAREYLGWQATRGIDTMCADTWRWQSLNPNGYA